MGVVHYADFKNNNHKRVYELDSCAGCFKPIQEDEGYTEVVLPYDDHKKHIALCDGCYKEACKHGAFK